MRRSSMGALVAMAAILGPAVARADSGTEARLREALRSAAAQVRALESEKAQWQSADAEQKQALEALRKQLVEAQRRPAARAPDRSAADLKECQAEQLSSAADAAKLRDDLAQCESSAREAAAARAQQEERAKVASAEAAALAEQRKACEAKNARMFEIAKSVLDQLWKSGAGEPLLGLKRVEVENFAQDAEDKLLETKVKP